MRALLLVAGAAMAIAACQQDEPAPVSVDNGVVVNEDEGNVVNEDEPVTEPEAK